MALPCRRLAPALGLLSLAVVGILLLVLPARDRETPAEFMYGIVLDAGSSHTSVYTYRWPADKHNGTGIVTQHSACHAEGGGISSYAGSPGGAARSLEACLDAAVKDIPKYRHPQTALYLGATAGMRLLHAVDAEESRRLLEEVARRLRSYPFSFTNATILGGREEGAYAWVSVNYLLENFVKYGLAGRWLSPGRGTVGALDLGGASTQVSFETAERVEEAADVTELRLYGRTYRLYSRSFLCYGQDQFLKRLLAQIIAAAGEAPQVLHPCYPRGVNVSVRPGRDVFDSPCTSSQRPAWLRPQRDVSVSVLGSGDQRRCLDGVRRLFSFNCSSSKCSFDGAALPPLRGGFMAFSAFFHTSNYIQLLTAIPPTAPGRLQEAVRLICNMSVAEMSQKTKQKEKYLRNVCAVANFVQVLLLQGYGFDERSLPDVSFQKKAGGASVGWALGCMLTLSGLVPAERLGVVKALPPGPWAGLLFLFAALLLAALGYLVMIYRTARGEEGVV